MHGARLVAGALAVALVLPACGERSCADVADDLAAELQEALDHAAGLTAADLRTDQGEVPPFLQDLQSRGQELEAEAEELGCSDEQMEHLVDERLDDLEAEPGTMADFLLQAILDEEFFDDPGTPTDEPSPPR